MRPSALAMQVFFTLRGRAVVARQPHKLKVVAFESHPRNNSTWQGIRKRTANIAMV